MKTILFASIALFGFATVAHAKPPAVTLTAKTAGGKKAYSYNPSFPNQPGSYNHHIQTSFQNALHTNGITTVRDGYGNTYTGSPNGNFGVKVTEKK